MELDLVLTQLTCTKSVPKSSHHTELCPPSQIKAAGIDENLYSVNGQSFITLSGEEDIKALHNSTKVQHEWI